MLKINKNRTPKAIALCSGKWVSKPLMILLCFLSLHVMAESDGLPRGAYQMPYVRYESESGNYGGGAVYYENPEFNDDLTAAEASDQQYIGLPSNGAYVEWSVAESADGVTLRFTMPDASGGEGQEGALDLYVNGSYVKTIDLSSYWAWQYFEGSDPQDTPGSRPRMRFDEVHFTLSNALSSGDVIRLQKNNGDALEYGVDFIETEVVPSVVSKPSGFISVTDYGAVADDNNDDLNAFYSALAAAENAGTGVYIPEGKFLLSDKLVVDEDNIAITGAGIWYTELYFTTEAVYSGGVLGECSNVDISGFYLNTVNNQRFLNGEYVTYKGFMGTYGDNSSIHDVWITHFECGAWIAGYSSPLVVTQNLQFYNNRIRNNYADGINLCQGTSNTAVYNNSFRSNGDDAMAVWPNNALSASEAVNNVFKYNTVENNYRAAGAAIFGGNGHEVHHCIIKDNMAGSGIRVTTDFDGYHFDNTTQIKFYENTITACGTSNDLWGFERGAIEINATNYAIKNIYFDNIDIVDAQRHAIQIGSANSVVAQFDNINIDGTGLDPYTESLYTIDLEGAAVIAYATSGTATFNNLTMDNIEYDAKTYKAYDSFNLIIESVDVPVEGVSLSQSAITIAAGSSTELTATVSPTNATNKTVTWTSSNDGVAVYNTTTGMVEALAAGTATIAVATEDGGYSASAVITVTSDDGDSDGEALYYIVNRWQNTYLYDGGERVQYSSAPSGEVYLWVLEAADDGQYEIRNYASDEYIHIENLTGEVECGPRTYGWMSSRWIEEAVGDGYVRFQNVWQSSYMHIEDLTGTVQYGTVDASWYSAQWLLVSAGSSARKTGEYASATVDVKELLTVYPNPATDKISVKGIASGKSMYTIHSMSGILIGKGMFENGFEEINTQNIDAGLYILTISSEDQVQKTSFIVK